MTRHVPTTSPADRAETDGATVVCSGRVLGVNEDWTFALGDHPGAECADFRDDDWRRLDLPHDWSIEAPFDPQWASGTGYLPGGIGWYRKRFVTPEGPPDSKVVVNFEGVYKNSDVWVNGHHLGRRPNGYISFHYDLTPFLNAGEKNILVVRVDHTDFADSRWYTGSGIYRDVALIVTGPLHVKQWGLFARTSDVLSGKAQLQIRTAIVNGLLTDETVTVENRLVLDGEGVGGTTQEVTIGPGGEVAVDQDLTVAAPALWDVDQPRLYTLETTIRRGDAVIDRQVTRIGFRDIRFDPEEGFFLNGRNLKLKGICMHHDAGCLGAAVPRAVLVRRLKLLKEMGCNAIRTSHNPFTSEFLDLCDEMGFLVIDEMFDEWEDPKRKWVQGWNKGAPSHDGYAADFVQWHEQDLTDFVLRDRNHPSVIMWSIGNEIDYPNDPYTHEILSTERNPQTFATFRNDLPHASRLGQVARELAAIVRRHDTTRPVTAGLASALMAIEAGYADALDVAGYNYQEFRYPEDHAKYPQCPLYGSENSKAASAWQAVLDHDYVMGQFLWTGFDYLGEAGQFPSRNSTAGTMDLAGNRKPEFYLRQSLWSDTPMVFIGAGLPSDKEDQGLWAPIKAEPHWNWDDDQEVQIDAYSNCDSVELLLNGVSQGIRTRGDGTATRMMWRLPFAGGTLTAIGRNDGQEAARFDLQTAGDPHALTLDGDADHLEAGSRDVAHIAVSVVDAHGTPVYDAADRVTCTIEGPGRLLGMEDANPRNTEAYTGNERDAFRGRLLLYVGARDEHSVATVTVTAKGLEPASTTITVSP